VIASDAAQSEPSSPIPLAPEHDLDSFDSGVPALDQWLKRRARRNEAEGASRTFVTCIGHRVVGYYSLSASSVLHAIATGRTRRNMPDPVPVVLLGRLAVDLVENVLVPVVLDEVRGMHRPIRQLAQAGAQARLR